MSIETIFLTQFALSLLLFTSLARWYVSPALAEISERKAIGLLLIPHALRYIGLVFLVPGVVAPEMAQIFATEAGYGDLAASGLAFISMLALRSNLPGAILLVWIFSVVGLIDLINALSQIEVVPYFHAAWYIPTILVPVLLVSHVMILTQLTRLAFKTSRPQNPAV